MIKSYPLNPRRLERLLTVLALRQHPAPSSEESLSSLVPILQPFDRGKVYESLPIEVRKRIMRNAYGMFEGITREKEGLSQKLGAVIFNRPFDAMPPLDRSLLLLGAYELQYNSSDPKIIVKEILICSDAMDNQKAGGYLSGILKSLAFGDDGYQKPKPSFHQKYGGKRPPKISLKRDSHGRKD